MTANVQSMSCVCGNTIEFLAIQQPTPLICPRCHDTVLSSTIPGPEIANSRRNDVVQAVAHVGAPADWRVGDIVFDNIQIMECLGSGGMGTVFRVRNHAWNIDLAMKCPNQRMLAWAGGVEHVERECNTWINLGLHAHVVTCYYVRRIEQVPHIFTDYVAGGDLGSWVKDRRLYHGNDIDALARILSVIIQCAWGLQFAHSASIVHLDVKPTNIVIADHELAKLTDFGLASKIRKDATTNDRASGSSSGGMTPAYCAPEQLTQRPVGFGTDIWALGVTLLELLVGNVKWNIGPEAPDYLDAHQARYEKEASIRKIPPSVVSILRACFKRRLNARLNSASELADMLANAYEECIGVPFPLSAPGNVPARIENSNNRAVSLWDLGERREAMAAWRATLGVQPGHFESTVNLALEQWRSAQITDEEVLRRIENLPSTSENTDDVVKALTDVHVERGDIERAKQLNDGSPDSTSGTLKQIIEQSIGASRTRSRSQLLHLDSVTAVAITPDRRFAFSASRDNSIRRWDVSTRSCTHVYQGHRGAVLGVTVSADGEVCVSHDEAGVVRLWRTVDGTGAGVYSGPWEQVIAVALAPDRESLIVLADKNVAYTVALATRVPVASAQGPAGIVHLGGLSKDGRVAASGLGTSTVAVWDPGSGKTVRKIGATKAELISVTVSESGRFVAWGDHAGAVRVLDLATNADAQEYRGHRGAVTDVRVMPDDRHAVSVGSDQSLRLWDLKSRRCLATMPAPSDHYISIASDECGQVVIAGSENGSVDFWRLSTNITFRASPFRLSKVVDTVSSQVIERKYEQAIGKALSALKSGNVDGALRAALAARSVKGCDRRLEVMRLWFELHHHSNRVQLNDAWEIEAVELPAARITAMAHIPRSARFVLGDSNGAVHTFNQETRIVEQTSTKHSGAVLQLVLSFDGSYAITRGEGGKICFWLPSELEKHLEYTQHSTHAKSMDLSPDTRYLVTADWGINIAHLFTGDYIATLGTCDDQVRAVRWMPDGNTIAVAAGESLCMCDIQRNTLTRIIETRPYHIDTIAVSPDGRYILMAGEAMASRRGALYIWDVKHGSFVTRRENLAHPVRGLCFLSDGRHFLLGTSDGVVAVWHVDSSECVRVLGDCSGSICSLAASQDGRYAFAVNQQGGAKIWALDWELDLVQPPDTTERISSIAECDKTARKVARALSRRWGAPSGAAGPRAQLAPLLPSIRRRVENAGLGGVSTEDLKRIARRPRWWYKK